jgi:hypothetical protein
MIHACPAGDLYQPYTAAGTPQTVWSYDSLPRGAKARGGGRTRHAIVVYACYIRDPLYEREPTADEVRQIVEYCDYWINAPCLVYPADELSLLRLSILRVTTAEQLAGWLWACGTIGLGNVLYETGLGGL